MIDSELRKKTLSALDDVRQARQEYHDTIIQPKRLLPLSLMGGTASTVPNQRIVGYDGEELEMAIGDWSIRLNSEPRLIQGLDAPFYGWMAPVVHKGHTAPDGIPKFLKNRTPSWWTCPLNTAFPLHAHEFEETYINLGPGTFVARVGDREVVLKPDACVHIPSWAVNGGLSIYDDCILMVNFHFGLDDYLI